MIDESRDKKNTVPDVPSAKSSSLAEGAVGEFDPNQPRLEAGYEQDLESTVTREVSTAPADPSAATTQPSLRRLQRAQAEAEPPWRKRALQGLLVFLCFAIAWEISVLLRTSRESSANGDAEPRALVQSSQGVRSPQTEGTEPLAQPLPAPTAEPAPEQPRNGEAPAATDEPPRVPSVLEQEATQPASALPAPVVLRDVEPSPQQGTSARPKTGGSPAPKAASSSKSQSKALFPPQ